MVTGMVKLDCAPPLSVAVIWMVCEPGVIQMSLSMEPRKVEKVSTPSTKTCWCAVLAPVVEVSISSAGEVTLEPEPGAVMVITPFVAGGGGGAGAGAGAGAGVGAGVLLAGDDDMPLHPQIRNKAQSMSPSIVSLETALESPACNLISELARPRIERLLA